MADVGSRHDHDPMLIASLLDDDLGDPDRAIATERVRICPSCAALHADLLALSVATQTQPAPTRVRDFRLTVADAVRLRAEPAAPEPRLTSVMTESTNTSAHRTHDTTLVASLADHSLATSERTAAEALVAACSECAALHADMLALVAATRAMPTPPRRIDYTLTPAHAARLRPSPWRRLVAAVGSSHDGVIRPLAVGLSTLGLVGILVASAPTILESQLGSGGSAASGPTAGSPASITDAAPAPVTDTSGGRVPAAQLAPTSGGAAAAESSSAPDRLGEGLAPVFGATVTPQTEGSPGPLADAIEKGTASAAPEAATDAGSPLETIQVARSGGVDPLLAVSTAFLVIGLGLFVLRWSARRLAD